MFCPYIIMQRLYFLTVAFMLINYVYTAIGSGTSANFRYDNGTITDATIRKLLDLLRDQLGTNLSLPDQSLFKVTDDTITNCSVSGSKATDASNYVIDVAHADMDTLTFTAQITYPQMLISGFYSLFIDNEVIRIGGDGSYSLNMPSEVTIFSQLSLQLDENRLVSLKELVTNYSIPSIQATLENIGGDEESSVTVNEVINELLPSIIEGMKPIVQETALNELTSISRFIFAEMTLEDLIELINEIINGSDDIELPLKFEENLLN